MSVGAAKVDNINFTDSDNDSVYSDSNLPSADEDDEPEKMTYAELGPLIDSWAETEVDLFHYIERWVDAEAGKRKKHLDNLLAHVRFCLMTPAELTQIQNTKTYNVSSGAWRLLVDKAIAYHKLPINMKILYESEQNTVRGKPAPTAFMNIEKEDRGTPRLYYLNKKMEWETAKIQPPVIYDRCIASVIVNNFLITADGSDEDQDFYVFDPRTLEYSQLPSCGMCKSEYSLVHLQGCLYLMGGSEFANEDNENLTEGSEFDDEEYGNGTVLKYEFKTNEWSHFVELPKLKSYIMACVFHDCIYVTDSHSVKCLDLETKAWEVLTPIKKSYESPLMCVMKHSGKEYLCMIDEMSQPYYYNESTKKWHEFKCSFSTRPPFDASCFNMVADGNTIFFYNDPMCGKWDEQGTSVLMDYPEHGNKVNVTELDEDFYPHPSYKSRDAHVVAMLAVPAYKVEMLDEDEEQEGQNESDENEDSDDSNDGFYEYTYGW